MGVQDEGKNSRGDALERAGGISTRQDNKDMPVEFEGARLYARHCYAMIAVDIVSQGDMQA
jgi:hypothetical protein